MKQEDSSLFRRLARGVQVRDLHRRFAFSWDLDKDGHEEVKLVQRYLADVGHLCSDPVLLTADYSVESAMINGKRLPFGAWFPEYVFPEALENGRLSESWVADKEEFGCGLAHGDEAFGTIEISPSSFISADTPLVSLFENDTEPFRARFVCEGNQWTGVLTQHELLSPPARLCLLALSLEFEERATALCRIYAGQCFASLPEERRNQAMSVFIRKHNASANSRKSEALGRKLNSRKNQVRGFGLGDAFFSLLVDCTTFIDKAKMLCKCKLLLDVSNSELKGIFARIENLRNFCAHTGRDNEDLIVSPKEIRQVVQDVHRLMATMKEAYDREWRVLMSNGPSGSAAPPQ